jgi:RHS repeat-associated protein
VLAQEDIVWSAGAGGGGSSDQSSYQSSFEDEFAFWQAVNAVMAGFGEAEARAARDNKLAQIASELLLLPPDEQARAMNGALAELGGVEDGADFFAPTLDDSGGQGGPADRVERGPVGSAGNITAQTTSGGGSAAQSSTSTVLWLLPDNLGTTRDVIDNSGALVNHITYAAFGAITAIVDATGQALTQSATRYLYTQREFDFATHLNYHRARYYDPTSGRWLSEDPISFSAGDPNLARYVKNLPTIYVDLDGLADSIPGASNYRDRVKEATASIKEWSLYQVHHVYEQGRLEQELARRLLVERKINVHDLEHLRIAPKFVHKEICDRYQVFWEAFWKRHEKQIGKSRTWGAIANLVNLDEYLKIADEIDAKYAPYVVKAGATPQEVRKMLANLGAASEQDLRSAKVQKEFAAGSIRRIPTGLAKLMQVVVGVGFVEILLSNVQTAKALAAPNQQQQDAFQEFRKEYENTLRCVMSTGRPATEPQLSMIADKLENWLVAIDMDARARAAVMKTLREQIAVYSYGNVPLFK